MIHNRSAKKYLCRVRGMLPCPRKMKRHIMEQICNDVSSYLEDQPEADYNTLLYRFGKPETIAISYISSVDAPEVLKKMHTRKWILSAVAAVLAFVVLLWTAAVAYEIIQNESNDGNGRIEVSFEHT